jgi:hypothetical protein
MDITVTVSSLSKLQALDRALSAYNAANPGATLDENAFMQRLIDGQLDGLVAAYLITSITPLAFLRRFTQDERVAIRTAAQESIAIADYLAMTDAAQEIDLTDTDTVAGLNALEAAELIAEGRAAQILSLMP